MMKLNLELPYIISNLCNKESIPIVYFSSLSIYGFPSSKYVNQKSQKNPIDLYGKSKYDLDKKLKRFSNENFVTAPASIINPNSENNNFLKKTSKVLSKKPLIWLLMFISPSGNYSVFILRT